MKKQPVCLNLGSGVVLAPPPFINVDKYLKLEDLKAKKGIYANAVVPKDAQFVQADLCDLPFQDNCADYIESLDTIEHLPFRKTGTAFLEMYRVLKPGGKLCLLTPNFDGIAQLWIEEVKGKPIVTKEDIEKYFDFMQVAFGNQIHEGEFHKTPFNPFFLGHLLMAVGFKEQNIKMNIYPKHCKDWPPFQTKPKKKFKGQIFRTEYIWVEATK